MSGLQDMETLLFIAKKSSVISVKKCGHTFSETKGTAFYRLRTDEDHVSNMISLMKHGCPPQAIVATYQHDERTVYDWYARGGNQCQQVHEAVVENNQIDIQHVQADELCVTVVRLHGDKEIQDETMEKADKSMQSQNGDLSISVQEVGEVPNLQEKELPCDEPTSVSANHMWMAMAMDVDTRLWLGGVVDVNRNQELIMSLAQKVRACAKSWNFLLSVDGLASYIPTFMFVFSWLIFTGQPGRPKRMTSPGLMIAQVIKEYAKGKVSKIIRRIVLGSVEAIELALKNSGCFKINTSYIERLNATFRGRLAALVRKGRAIAHMESPVLKQGMYLTGTSYNFCYFHESLRIAAQEGSAKKWIERTPAMAAGLTDHRWTMKELLSYKVPPKIKTYVTHV